MLLVSKFALANVLNPSDIVKTFNSGPYGGACYVVKHFPEGSGADYKGKDEEKEQKLCAVDLDDANVGLCPKEWSTSPATIMWDLSKTVYAGRPNDFEKEICSLGDKHGPKNKVKNIKKIGAYKQSVNAQYGKKTSGTYAQGSLMYYHFSRFFDTTIDIPVSVLRTASIKAHYDRVVTLGSKIAKYVMITAGWGVLAEAYKHPGGYDPSSEIFDQPGIMYGVMLKGSGNRYGFEWSVESLNSESEDFKRIPAYRALSKVKSLEDAIKEGVAEGKKGNKEVAAVFANGVSNEQMVLWMEELSEMNILDYIFRQQDRVRNFDYVWQWNYINAEGKLDIINMPDELGRADMVKVKKPEEIPANARAVLVQKTQLVDNDAGGRLYRNDAKKHHYLEEMHHIRPHTYKQLLKLADDFKSHGELYNYFSTNFSISPKYVEAISNNVIEAAKILVASCKSDKLRFDLDSKYTLETGLFPSEQRPANCEKP